MKISDKNNIVNLEAYIQKANANKKMDPQTQKPVEEAPSKVEKVEISAKARDIQKAKKILDGVPDIRKEKVDKLKNSIEDNTYNVRGEKVAEKMVKESLLDEIL